MKISWASSPAGFFINIIFSIEGHINTFTSPVLLIHGDSDRNVDFQETIGLTRALRAKGYPYLIYVLFVGDVKVQVLIFPNERHGLALYRNDVAAAVATFNFLANNL